METMMFFSVHLFKESGEVISADWDNPQARNFAASENDDGTTISHVAGNFLM